MTSFHTHRARVHDAVLPPYRRHSFEPALRVGWSRTWRREHMTGSGEPSPHWPGVRGTARVERLESYTVDLESGVVRRDRDQ
ncbi:hypothetical protein ACIQOV_34635 [Kitasatospora sp. NPDC091257]|uniref:hypothetical protein n=1 Tax=Kitasatospora sp. NPDC091257 TaxID=3364084 RepID=UPI00380B143A